MEGEVAPIYYPETGHTVSEPFLTFYLKTNGIKRLGYPITEVIEHEGWQVQYFQNARLELHPENDHAYRITVGWLGELLHRTRPPILNPFIRQGKYFPKTGHTLHGQFLTYFENNGGSVQFGLPISEPFMANDGLIYQDLQSARFIWYPTLPKESQVQLEPLGEIYFLQSGLSLDYLKPIHPPSTAVIQQSTLMPRN
ncbi:MAG: hypothetical protein B6242_11480 [Anaerolineaceae bacterium 4572_78]|nr:MAG: hypothetical protein B6242_11480 [Anaerolineaceae bacterium 4572_78]